MSLHEKVCKAAKQDKVFISEFNEVPNQSVPGFWASENDKAMFACFYCGWLIGKHGPQSAQAFYENIKAGAW